MDAAAEMSPDSEAWQSRCAVHGFSAHKTGSPTDISRPTFTWIYLFFASLSSGIQQERGIPAKLPCLFGSLN